MSMKHTFGPVPSRRLGFSLGIDIIPPKTCTYNCIYCQLFQTSNHTKHRQSFFDRENIIADIKDSISRFSDIDYLTFSGSGEPTLNTDIGHLIKEVKTFSSIPVAVITNSSLLWMPEVRDDIKDADLVVPSVDSVTPEVWSKINRPAPGIMLNRILEGIKDFCSEYKGEIWVEIMLVQGVNSDSDEIEKIARFVNLLDNVNKVQINTVVRPPNETSAKPLDHSYLKEIIHLFDVNAEIIAPFNRVAGASSIEDKEKLILDLLVRRPCSSKEMADSLGLNLNEVIKHIQKLESEQKIMKEDSGYYSIKH